MKAGHILLFFIFLNDFFFYSCKKDASYAELPEFREKLVVNAFVSPDLAENKIFISWTRPRYGNLEVNQSPRNLSIFLYENSKEVQLDTIRENGQNNTGAIFHLRNFNFKHGQTYHLTVISDPGLKAEATCQIPLKRDFKLSVDTVFRKSSDNFGNRFTSLIIKPSIIDFPGETNYYRVLYLYDLFIHGTRIPIDLHLDDGDKMDNDTGSDGEKMFLRSAEIPSYFLDWEFYGKPDSGLLTVYLLNTDKPYNDFHVSHNNYSSGEDPFTEPTIEYSNIQGGLGIFASYVVDSLIFRLK